MKRYFWAKIATDFFEQPICKKLRRCPNGSELQVLFMKLILLAVPQNGLVPFLRLEETVEEELALSLDADLDDVTNLLAVLKRANVWTVNENGDYNLAIVPSLVGSETPDAARKREQRQRTMSDNVPTKSDAVPVVDKRRIKKTKTEESISKKSQEENSHSSPSGTVPTPRAFEGGGGGGTITIDDLADPSELHNDDGELPF